MVVMRMCISCRERQPKNELMRVVSVQGRLMVDFSQTAPGRGASLHKRSECIQFAVTRHLLSRALRVSPHVDVSEIEALLDS